MEEKGFWYEVGAFFTRWSAFIFPVVFGLMGRYGLELAMKRQYTLLQWIGISFVSIFSGYITSIACIAYDWKIALSIFPSLSTLFGYNAAMYVVYNYKKIGDRALDILTTIITRKK